MKAIKNLIGKLAKNEEKYNQKKVQVDLQKKMKELEKRIADLERQVQSQREIRFEPSIIITPTNRESNNIIHKNK